MKNQYVGDVGDYGKYGMLRFFIAEGITLGVNWYLTENDRSNDGKHLSYLEKPEYRIYDPKLYDYLKSIAHLPQKSVNMLESSGLFTNTCFYHSILHSKSIPAAQRLSARNAWHKTALQTLNDAKLVFLDPDNGMIGKKALTDPAAEKYTFPKEVVDYYQNGQNVVYYCHKGRRTASQWTEAKFLMRSYLPDVRLCAITYHRGTQRSYIFVLHPEDYARYQNLLSNFLATNWGHLFTEEPFSDFPTPSHGYPQ